MYSNNIHNNLQLKLTLQIYACINILDHLLKITSWASKLEVYRKPTSTDTSINHNSKHHTVHKLTAFRFLLSRMHQLLLTTPYKQKEWNTIQRFAKANAFPHALMKFNTEISHKLTLSPTNVTALTTTNTTTTSPKTWVTFTYYNPMVRKLTRLFCNTNFKIAFCTNNTIHNSLHNRPYYKNIHSHSGIYQLQCQTRKLIYSIGQTGYRL